MTLRIAPLSLEYRAALRDLLVATRAFSGEEVGVAMALFDATYMTGTPSGAASGYEFVAAFDAGDRLLGYACFGPTPMTEHTFDLYWLAVHPEAQRAGVGRAVVNHVESGLARRDARLLVVETSSRSDYAHTRAFYARRGYQEAARVRDFYAPADDRIIFTTRLTRERGVVTP